MQLNLSLRQAAILNEILEDSAKQQEGIINLLHTTTDEAAMARDKIVVIRSIQAEGLR